jgi:hypothetical protein
LSSRGQRGSGSDAKVDFLMQKAVFVTDHEPCFGVILTNYQAQSASFLRDIEDEIGGVRSLLALKCGYPVTASGKAPRVRSRE